MIFFTRIYTIIVTLTLCSLITLAQDAPIGYWESHLPYNTAVGLATDGNTLYAIGNQSFFSLNSAHGENMTAYSKTDGMSDMGMQCTGYDMSTSTLILVYSNGNIDLFKDNTFYNIGGYKTLATGGRKIVYNIYTENGFAYLSSTQGIIIIDLINHNIAKTIAFSASNPYTYNVILAVTSFIRTGNYFYAATENGIYRTDKNNPQIINTQTWQRIDSLHGIINIAIVDDQLLFSSAKSVYKLTSDTLQPLYTTSELLRVRIRHIDAGNNKLIISEYSDSTKSAQIKFMDINDNLTDSFPCDAHPKQVIELMNSTIWVADSVTGLQKRTGATQRAYYTPDGPSSPNSFDIYANNRNVYVAHGEYNQFFGANFTNYGISYYHDNKWKLYKTGIFHPIDYVKDITVLAKDESAGTLYAGSFLNGLVVLGPDDHMDRIDKNSIFDGSGTYGDDYHQLIGMDLDKSENLWMTLINSVHPLYVKTKDNNWYKFKVPDVAFGGPLVVDDNGQIYFLSFLVVSSGGGVCVYNTNGTVSDPTDDASYHIRAGAGFGNLPSNNVTSIVKDKNNEIWVGTDNGIAIIKNNCKAPFSNAAPCEAEIPIVQYSNYSGPLFAGNNINTIAVDEANRKWVGTNNGVWLLSPDAKQIISRFTAESCPLPSDHIQKISIDKVTGDVYIGTDKGLVSYHGTVTEAGTSNQNPLIFPNPVPAGYTGSIAIRGLLTNSDIRITDINGQLVYHTTVETGGQATWDGNDYKGHRPQSGIYLVFIANKDGKQTYTGKIVFVQ